MTARITLLILLGMQASLAAQDTVVVQIDSVPQWGADAHLTEDLSIGVIEGPDEYAFGFISALAVGLDGSIYVYDHYVPVIRQYDSAGMYIRDVGREGRGPGEYRAVQGMRVLASGILAIWDVGNGRITVYDSVGSYRDSHRVPSALHTSANTFTVDTAGNMYVLATDQLRIRGERVRDRQGGPGVVTTAGEMPKLLIKVSPEGDLVDSIPLPPEEKGAAFVLMTAEGPRWNFPTGVCSALSNRGYLVVGRNDKYAFDLRIPGGPVRRLVRDFESVRFGRAERAQWEARARIFEEMSGETYPPIPDTKPAHRDVYVDDNGRIWVDRYVEAVKRDVEPRDPGDDRPLYEWREPSTFDVIGPDGTYFGTLVVPENTLIFVRRGDHVWGVQRGELDEQYVVRFRIMGRGG